MSLFASRRNTRNEEAVFLHELRVFLDAREVPSDPIRKAQFWADYYRTGLAEPDSPRVPGGESLNRKTNPQSGRAHGSLHSGYTSPSGSASPVQDPLFSEEAA